MAAESWCVARPDRAAGLPSNSQSRLMSRLLIIEDELPMRTALKDCLEAEGYRVLTASDGEAGLERALKEKPDLVLLDIMLPKLDGFALCAELRRLSNNVPVLMLTAKGQVEDRVSGPDADRPRWIKTVHGVGYRLESPTG